MGYHANSWKSILMLNIVNKISSKQAICKCSECGNEYLVKDTYSSSRTPTGHLCNSCKSYEGYELNQAFLQKFFLYAPNTGKLIARLPTRNNSIGDELGSIHNHGYRAISICGKSYLAHRLIWLYMTGDLPEQVDHIDHDRLNNRWENLRAVTSTTNSKNTGLSKNSKTKVNGVSYIKTLSKYRAYIMVNRKHIHLGVFEDINDAIEARKQADINYGFHPNHGN